MTTAFKICSAPELMKSARKIADVDVFDRAAVEPLQVLVASFNNEASLHEAGAVRVETKLLRILVNRLRMIRDLDAHPEILDQPVRGPIFVSGTVRTGSTKMQRMLSSSNDFNWMPMWMAMNSASVTGISGEDVGTRVADAEFYVSDLNTGSPRARALHELSAEIADEDTHIMMQALHSPGFMAIANLASYFQWLAVQDMRPAYEYLRDVLKYLQWQGLADPAKPWFLKSPFHCGMEEVLRSVFPQARLVVTHRSPAELIPSMCSLISGYIESHTSDNRVDSPAVVAGFAASLERHIDFRKKNPGFPILDIHFREVTRDVPDVIDRFYRFIDMPLAEESRERILRWNADNPMHQHGAHRYTLDDFGITAAQIDQQCPTYMEFFQRFSTDTEMQKAHVVP